MPETIAELRPDLRGCTVAQAVGELGLPGVEQVILFGSRARGDYREDSDIDLLVITNESGLNNAEYTALCRAASRKAEEAYGGMGRGVQVLPMPAGRFDECRRARNHVAGQAARDGFDGAGRKVRYELAEAERTNWPDIRQRIINAERELRVLNDLVQADSAQEAIGFHAQQALENALKGWISALDGAYINEHDIANLAGIVRQYEREMDTDAGERLTWLSKYAVKYRYEGVKVEIEDRFELLQVATETVNAIITRIRQLSGPDPAEPAEGG